MLREPADDMGRDPIDPASSPGPGRRSDDEEDDARARAAVRLGGEYMLSSIHMLAELTDGEILTALISLAIVQANVIHLSQGAERDEAYDSLRTVPPDSLRRPVSVMALSLTLGLPYETTRRHVEKMRRDGQCERVHGGVIIPARAIDTDQHRRMLRNHMNSLRRLFRDLKVAGVELD